MVATEVATAATAAQEAVATGMVVVAGWEEGCPVRAAAAGVALAMEAAADWAEAR